MYGFGDNEFKKRQDELQKMKFEMDGLQKSFSEMPGIKLGLYDLTGRENPNLDTTLGKFFANKDNVGSVYESFQPQNTDFKSVSKGAESLVSGFKSVSKGVGSLVSGFKSGGSESISGEAGAESLGGLDSLLGGLKSGGAEGSTDALASASGGMDIASSSVAAGVKALTMSQTTANNDGESVMNGIDMTMKGAQAGMAIGGPVGAGIGAGAGLIYGVVDGFTDANKRGRNERKANKEKFNENRLRREQEYRMEEGKDSLESLSRLRKSQMNYLI